MKLLRILLFCISCFYMHDVVAQTQLPNVTADYIKLDIHGSIYVVKEAQLFKFSPKGELLFKFSDNTLGSISSIDVFNPMKIMLFYQDAGTLLFLNEQLARIQQPISLFDANYFTISLASYSAANQIHLYDNTNKYLITLDFNMREISRTPTHFPGFNPQKIIELEEKSVAFYDSESGVYLFDTFGTFNKLIPIITPHSVEITTELIYYTNNSEVAFYNYKTMKAETQQLPVSNVLQTLFYRNNIIVLLENKTIWIYEKIQSTKQ